MSPLRHTIDPRPVLAMYWRVTDVWMEPVRVFGLWAVPSREASAALGRDDDFAGTVAVCEGDVGFDWLDLTGDDLADFAERHPGRFDASDIERGRVRLLTPGGLFLVASRAPMPTDNPLAEYVALEGWKYEACAIERPFIVPG